MPTFGQSPISGGGTFPCDEDRALLSKFTAPASGTITQINQVFDATSAAGGSFKGLVYAADGAGGIPGTRLGVGGATAVPAGGGDLASTGLFVTITGGVSYWLGVVCNSFNPVLQTETSGAASRMEATTYATPAATWTEAGVGVTNIDVYATYVQGPTITAQPNNQSVYVGQTATFTVTATGTGTLHYQWKDDGSNVGTDSSTYAPTVALADNGSIIRCDVSDDNGTTPSNNVLLTVSPVSTAAWLRA